MKIDVVLFVSCNRLTKASAISDQSSLDESQGKHLFCIGNKGGEKLVNYGYTPDNEYWDESKKYILANELAKLLQDMKLNDEPFTHHFAKPNIEVDNLYQGVRIRKITHLDEETEKKLLQAADKIYLEIMAGKKEESQSN